MKKQIIILVAITLASTLQIHLQNNPNESQLTNTTTQNQIAAASAQVKNNTSGQNSTVRGQKTIQKKEDKLANNLLKSVQGINNGLNEIQTSKVLNTTQKGSQNDKKQKQQKQNKQDQQQQSEQSEQDQQKKDHYLKLRTSQGQTLNVYIVIPPNDK